MTQILILGACLWKDSGLRARRFPGALRDCALLAAEPGRGRGLFPAYGESVCEGALCLFVPRGKSLPWDTRGLPARLWLGRQAEALHRALQTRGGTVDILWCEMPVAKEVLARLPHRKLIYDVQAVPRNAEAAADMARRADAVTVSSYAAAEGLREFSSKLCYLPDGTDFGLLSRSGDPLLPFPSDLFHIREPILGHIGAPGPRAELGFAEQAAAANPTWNFVFLCDPPPEKTLPNIHYLGYKTMEQLPAYLSHFNLCFRIEGSDAEEELPPSLFACFAAGKPLVTTLYPKRVLDFAEVVYLAPTAEGFAEGCRKALGERDAWRRKERITYAKASSWEAGAARLEAFLHEKDVL